MAGLVGAPRGRAPRMPENVRQFAKKFLKKIAKMHYFSLFFKLFAKFLRFWTKNTIGWEIFEKIMTIFDENAIEKLNFYLFYLSIPPAYATVYRIGKNK